MSVVLKPAAQLAQSNGVKILVYGDAGTGKTVLSATAPRPVLFSSERGLLSLRHSNIPTWEFKTVADLIEIHKWATSSTEAQNFDTICLDSISEITEVILADQFKRNKDPRKAYGETANLAFGFFRDFRDIVQKHVYFIAKKEYTKDETTGAMLYGPALPGNKIGQGLPYFFDEVFQLCILKDANGANVRALRTQPDNQNIAKDRSGVLDYWEYPNLSNIIAKIMKG